MRTETISYQTSKHIAGNSTKQQQRILHTVEKEDTLEKLALKYSVSICSIREENGLTTSSIQHLKTVVIRNPIVRTEIIPSNTALNTTGPVSNQRRESIDSNLSQITSTTSNLSVSTVDSLLSKVDQEISLILIGIPKSVIPPVRTVLFPPQPVFKPEWKPKTNVLVDPLEFQRTKNLNTGRIKIRPNLDIINPSDVIEQPYPVFLKRT